jgi:hypothetical protein
VCVCVCGCPRIVAGAGHGSVRWRRSATRGLLPRYSSLAFSIRQRVLTTGLRYDERSWLGKAMRRYTSSLEEEEDFSLIYPRIIRLRGASCAPGFVFFQLAKRGCIRTASPSKARPTTEYRRSCRPSDDCPTRHPTTEAESTFDKVRTHVPAHRLPVSEAARDRYREAISQEERGNDLTVS